jgi:Nucleotide-diphospho-sugar transferase
MITFATFHIDCTPKAADHISKNNIHLDDRSEYLMQIDLMFRSAALAHPNCKKVVLTDLHTAFPGLSSDIQIYRLDLNPELVMLSRLEAQLHYITHHDLGSDIVLLDSDMLIQGSLKKLFSKDFSVGLTYRDPTESNYQEMPFNGGVIFVTKSQKAQAIQFLERVYTLYQTEYSHQGTWWGDQYAMLGAVGQENFHQRTSDLLHVDNAKVQLLPCSVYNFSPNNKYRAIALGFADKKVIHFKGPRKRLMPIYWDAYLKPRECSGLNQIFSSVVNWINLLSHTFQEAVPTGLFLVAHTLKK